MSAPNDPVTLQNAAEGGALQIIAGKRRRNALIVQADKDNVTDCYIQPSKQVTVANGIRLEPGQTMSFPDLHNLGANGFSLWGIHGGSNGDDPVIRILEV